MKRPLFLALLGALLGLGLAACLPIAVATTPLPPLPTPTDLPPTITPTPTPVWFPPTSTPTPLPTPTLSITPTVEVRPQIGALLFSDDFSDAAQWSLGRLPAGSAALGKNELTIAIQRERGYVYALRQATDLRDFYLEITASPSICRGEDEYGLLLRVSPSLDFYRFSLTCDGRTRVDRFIGGRATSPQSLTYSASVPPGAPSQSRLGVAARGRELSFFINDEYQFTIRDPSLPGGTLGVFARAAGADAVTVNFSDLSVYGLEP